jgi:polar amino acid transport system ATP-binding protein
MISVANVSKRFGSHEILKGVTFSVSKGEVVCLIGPSGSGKSTLLRCINGLELCDEGQVIVNGIAVNEKTKRRVRQQVAMVFQRFNLFPHRTVLENVTEGPIHVLGVAPAIAQERARQLLERVGLEGKADAYPSRLSGGQQQRVGIARALAMDPIAILFDEPTSALDPERVGDILELMRNVAEGGMTMVVVTHEMSFAREVAGRVLFLDEGRIVECGPPKEIFSNPKVPRTRQFLERIIHPL